MSDSIIFSVEDCHATEDREVLVGGTLSFSEAMYPFLCQVQRCCQCSGFGARLLLKNHGMRCASCVRASSITDKAWVDITSRLDGGVMKASFTDLTSFQAERSSLLLRVHCRDELDSNWQYTLRDGCRLGIHYVARLQTGEIVGSSRDLVDGKNRGGTDDPIHVVLGGGLRVHLHRGGLDGAGEAAAARSGPPPRQQLILGLEIGLRTMAIGETAIFRCRSDYAHGFRGDGFKIPGTPPDHFLSLEVELLWALSPLPQLPQGAKLERQQRTRKAAEAERYRRGMSSITTRLLNSTSNRLAGNAFIAVGAYAEAKKLYDAGFVDIFVTKEEWDALPNDAEEGPENEEDDEDCSRGYLTPEEKLLLRITRRTLYMNRALVNMKLQRLNPALWDIDQALLLAKEIESDNKENSFYATALFRKGTILLQIAKSELRKEDEGVFWDIAKAQEIASRSGKCFYDAFSHIELNDASSKTRAIAKCQIELRRTALLIDSCAAAHEAAWGAICRDKIFAGLARRAPSELIKDKHEVLINKTTQGHTSDAGSDDEECFPVLESSSEDEDK